MYCCFFFQAEDGIRDSSVTGVQTCALPIYLLVANDSTPNYLYRNRRDGTFEDVSYFSGFAVNEEGRAQASMGIGVGDYNRDGKLDLFVTTFSDDYKTLYRNDGGANFTDVSFRAGLGNPTIP